MATTEFYPIRFCGFKVSKDGEGIEIRLLEETSATRDGFKILETPIKELSYAFDDGRYTAKTNDNIQFWLVLSQNAEKQCKQKVFIYILDKYFRGQQPEEKELLTEEELWEFEGYKQDVQNERYWVV